MIKIKKEDNLLDILEKIKNCKKKKIVLNFPLGHYVLYNKLALKSIKNIAQDKKIIIETKDILSKKIGKQLSIKYNILGDGKTEKNLMKLNYSFFEYLLFEIKKIYLKIFKKQQYLDPRKKFLKFYRQKSNSKIFISLLFFSILIFLYLFLFVFNKTFVYITPNIEVRTKSLNFLLTTKKATNNIDVLKISKTIKLQKNIITSGISISPQNKARGKVELINKLEQEVKLKSKTRLQTDDGLLFEIKDSITIPKAVKNKLGTLIPGRKSVEVIAKTKDINGEPIGVKGNILKDRLLILPGLPKELQKDIFAKALNDFKGGKDKFEKVILQEDLDNAKKIFEEQLKKQAIISVKKELEKINKQKNIKYKIPNINDIFYFSDLKIDLGGVKPGDKKNSFLVSGEIKVVSYAYDSSKVLSKLKNEIEKHLLEGKEKLIDIDEKSLNSENKVGIIYRTKNPFSIKITLSVNYYVEYDFGDNKDNYINRLKQTIAGLEKQKAENILINEEKISSAKIKIRPFFINKVSSYPNNIEFIVDK